MSGNLQKLAATSLIVIAALSCSPVSPANTVGPGLPSSPSSQSALVDTISNDVKIGDPATDYMAIEFSPDMRYMAWIEPTGGISLSDINRGAEKTVWLCAMDSASGEMIPPSGKGFRIAAVSNFGGSPQWGHDDQGIYLAMVDQEGYIVIARPEMQSGNTVKAAVNRLPTAPNLSRTFAYPSRIRGSSGFIVYIQKDIQGEVQLHYLDLAHPRDEHQITKGPQVKFSKAQIPAFLVDVQRWFYDVETLADGLPVIVYGDAASGKTPTLIEIKQVDL